MELCAKASQEASMKQRNHFEDITAAPDAFQAIVSTPEKLVSARRVTAGCRATRILGSASDAILQQMSRNHSENRRSPIKETHTNSKIEIRGTNEDESLKNFNRYKVPQHQLTKPIRVEKKIKSM